MEFGHKGQITMELSVHLIEDVEELKADWLWIGPIFRTSCKIKGKAYKLSYKHKHCRQRGGVVSKNSRVTKFPSESKAYKELL